MENEEAYDGRSFVCHACRAEDLEHAKWSTKETPADARSGRYYYATREPLDDVDDD